MAAGMLTTGSSGASAAQSPFRAPVQLPRSNSRKSPPLAFAKTSNDALLPLTSPPEASLDNDPFSAMSPIVAGADAAAAFYQSVVDKQSVAISALHVAFAAEREAWASERIQLYHRVAKLEKLLRAQNGHSPAKSPIISPSGASITSPQSRAVSAPPAMRLASIAEDENLRPLSERRQHAPRTISIPVVELAEKKGYHNRGESVDFSAAALDELGVSPPLSAKRVSPPEMLAKDTAPVMAHRSLSARPPTPPPKDMTLIGVEDTPTRNNTHINALLTQSSDEEEDIALTGPLNMPELPSKPSSTNFTEDMLIRKLEMIAQNPETNKPTIFSSPSPGLAIAEEHGYDAGLSPRSNVIASSTEGPIAPVATREHHNQGSLPASAAISPSNGAQQPSSHDSDHDQKFAQGGIRLKKKPSSNFGAPFGQLTGFGSLRKMS